MPGERQLLSARRPPVYHILAASGTDIFRHAPSASGIIFPGSTPRYLAWTESSLRVGSLLPAGRDFELSDAHRRPVVLRACHKINRTFRGDAEGLCSSTLRETRRARFESTPLPRLTP